MSDTAAKIIGDNIRLFRNWRKLSERKLAERVGTYIHFVRVWEEGLDTPDSVNAKKIAEALDVPVSALLNKRKPISIRLCYDDGETEVIKL